VFDAYYQRDASVSLIVLSMGGQSWDIRTPTGRLMLTMLGAVADYVERAVMWSGLVLAAREAL
jgi:hypothetical protein